MRSSLNFRGISIVLLSLAILLPSSYFAATGAAKGSSPQSVATTFYLHDDQHGFGDYSKRFDWANTSVPYNPPNPYFISSSYQGIALNADAPDNSFRWIVSPAAGVPLQLSGTVNVTLYMTPSNTSTGSPVDIRIILQNVTGGIPHNISSGATGNISLVPNERVYVDLAKFSSYALAAGSSLVLNATRIDSNVFTSVYVEFDYNNVPSNFRLNITPRISSLEAVVNNGNPLYDNQSLLIHANVTDALGYSDIAGVSLSIVNSTGYAVVSGLMSNYSAGIYFRTFSFSSAPVRYGNYTIEFRAFTAANLTGYMESYYINSSIQVRPSLEYFSLPAAINLTAGAVATVNSSAVADNGAVMQSFNGTARVTLLSGNGSQVNASGYAPGTASFINGYSSINLTVYLSGNFTLHIVYSLVYGSSSVHVIASSVSRIVISPGSYSMLAGESERFTAEGFDAYGNLNTTWTPLWNVTGNIGNVTQAGEFQALRNGTGRIVASDTASGVSGYATVSVSSSSLFALEINPSNETLLAGQTYFFQVMGYDAYGNAVQVENVLWATNAGTLYVNGSYAVLNASAQPLSSGYIEAAYAGLTARASLTVVPSAFSPHFVSAIPVMQEPSNYSWQLNLGPFVQDPNDPYLAGLEWFLYGGNSLFYTYGSGSFGNTNVTFISYPDVYGYANATLVVVNRDGYSASTEIQIRVLPVPEWNSSMPHYLVVQDGVAFSLNFTYFLAYTPYTASEIKITTSSPYVYTSGEMLTYLFPSAAVHQSFPVLITASEPDNMTAGFVQLVTVSMSVAPSVDVRNAPPSFISIDRGETEYLPYSLNSYFYSITSLSYSVYSAVVSAHVSPSGTLELSAPAMPSSLQGMLLIEANNTQGEMAFLLIRVGIVDIVTPPSVAPIPEIRVHYVTGGGANYALSLLPYVSDTYVPLDQVSVLTGSDMILFSRGNFSLLFSMPANSSGGSTYLGPYWYNTSLLFIGGPIPPASNDSVSVSIAVYVSSLAPPAVAEGAVLPTIISVPENGVSQAINLSALFYSPQGEPLSFSGSAANVSITISPSGLVSIAPSKYFAGSVRADFFVNSSAGFIDYSIVIFVYPIEIPPVVSIPSSVSTRSTVLIINLLPYISNPNHEPITIAVSGRGATAVGSYILISLPAGTDEETVTVFVSTVQGHVNTSTLTVHVIASPISIYAVSFYALLSLVAVLGAALLYMRFRHHIFQLETILLISNDGRLIASHNRKGYEGVDRDIVVGMFTAIQDFVSTSFSGTENAEFVRRIEFGKYSISIDRGRNIFAISIYSGQAPGAWDERMRAFVSSVERRYQSLENWDGSRSSITGIDEMISKLFQ
jgi:hypothetical protein